jgi:hypothetical protein
MFEVLIISPFAYALEKQKDFVKLKLFCDEITDYKIHTIKALPDEIDGKIHGKQFDYAYIDVNYINSEVGKIREHVNGMQSKQIERF